MKPLVSIIIPVYNVQNYLRECLESVVNQTYQNLDIVVVDDGSVDSSLEIALEYARKDDRVFVISKANGGQSTARNMGLEFIKNTELRQYLQDKSECEVLSFLQTHSFSQENKKIDKQWISHSFEMLEKNVVKTSVEEISEFVIQSLPESQFIHFLDADDYLYLDCIEKMVSEALKNNLDICAHNHFCFFQTEKRYEEKHSSDIPNKLKKYFYSQGFDAVIESQTYSFVFVWQGIFKTDVLNRYHLRFVSGIYSEDNDFGIILFALSSAFAYVDYVGMVYRIHQDSSSFKERGLKYMQIPKKLPKYLEQLRPFFSNYVEMKNYFNCYCVCKSGLQIEKFFRDCCANGGLDLICKNQDFFKKSLAWHFDLCRVPLEIDPLGIKEMMLSSGVRKRDVLQSTLKQFFRHPKKIKYFKNLKLVLKL